MAGLDPDLSSYGGFNGTNKLLATASNGPENLNGWLTAARQGQALSSEQFDLGSKRLTALNGLAASVMADPSLENATARITDGVKLGVIPPEEGAREMQTLSSFGGDPTKIKQWGFQHWSGIASAQQQLNTAYGTPGTIDNGPAINPVVTREGPQAGVYAAGGNALKKYMSPAEAGAPQDYPDPVTGRTIYSTRRGYGQAVGDTASLPPDQGAPAPSPAPAPGYSGVVNPDSYVDPRRAGAGVSIVNKRPVYGDAAQPNGPVGGRAGTNSRGAANPQATVPGLAGPSPMLESGRKTYQDDLATASSKMQGVQQLTQALPLIQQLGTTGSGPGSPAFNKVKSALITAGVLSPDTSDVAAFDEAKKYLSNYVSRSALAGRSDMGQLQQLVVV